jgi:hypothetical protein
MSLDDIQSFLKNGNPNAAPEGVAEYLELLDKVRGMLIRFDKYPNDNLIIKALLITDKLSPYKAKQVINEAREFFYCDQKVSIEAWQNIYAEKMDKLINLAMMSARDAKDLVAIGKLVKDAYEIRGGGKDVKEELPEELFSPKWVVYTADAEALGLPKVDRNRIKEFIDNKVPELTESERNRLYQEADILPFKALPNDKENPRKN